MLWIFFLVLLCARERRQSLAIVGASAEGATLLYCVAVQKSTECNVVVMRCDVLVCEANYIRRLFGARAGYSRAGPEGCKVIPLIYFAK